MEPKFLRKAGFKAAGINYRSINSDKQIKELWEKFIPMMDSIPDRINKETSYGICRPMDKVEEKIELISKGSEADKSNQLDYIASVEVSSFDKLDEGMDRIEVPEQDYAVFTHKGSVDKIQETLEYIFREWLPESGYVSVKAPVLELYDERFEVEDVEKAEFDIYIPVKGKE